MIKFDRNALITRGTSPKVFAKKISRVSHFEVQGMMMDLAEWSLQSMKNIIASKKKRSNQTTLEDNLTMNIVSIPSYIEIGVGDIKLLNANAEYWQVLNSGMTRSGKRFLPYNGKYVPKGEFSDGDGKPKAGAEGGTWLKGQGNYTFKAKKFIEPTNYIDITVNGLKTKFWGGLVRIQRGLEFTV